MVSCCVLKCSNSSRNKHIRFFKLPKFTRQNPLKFLNIRDRMKNKQFMAWVKVINRTEIGEDARVCSAHFATGEAARWSDNQNKDWLPHLKMGYKCDKRVSEILQNVNNENAITANSKESESHDFSTNDDDREEQDVINDGNEEHNLNLAVRRTKRLNDNKSLTMNTEHKASNIRQHNKRYYKRGTRHVIPFIENGVPVSFEITELEEIRFGSHKTKKLQTHTKENGSTVCL